MSVNYICRLIMKAEMDKIVTLSDGDRTAELQKYLSSLTDDQVGQLICEFNVNLPHLSYLHRDRVSKPLGL